MQENLAEIESQIVPLPSQSNKSNEILNPTIISPRKTPKPIPLSIIIPGRSESDLKRTDSESQLAKVRQIEVKPAAYDEETVSLNRVMACLACARLLHVLAKVLVFTAVTLNVMTVISTEVVKMLVNLCPAKELSSTSLKTQAENCYSSNSIWNAAFYMSAFILGAVGFHCFRCSYQQQTERSA